MPIFDTKIQIEQEDPDVATSEDAKLSFLLCLATIAEEMTSKRLTDSFC